MRRSSRLLICRQGTKNYGTARSLPVILRVIRSLLDGGTASDSLNLLKGEVENGWKCLFSIPRLLKTAANKAAAEENTGGVPSGLR
jgi:hypothetical protein